MRIHNCQQRSDEWFALRCGRITASQFATMANGTKAGVEKLCWKIATERHTGVPCESGYVNAAMERGMELESEARMAFEADRLVVVDEVGFVEMDDLIGCSPDGLIGDDAGLELKCPEMPTHYQYLREGRKGWRGNYWWQVQGSLWVTGRKRWYFVSYHPDFPETERLYVDTVEPAADAFAKLHIGMAACRDRISALAGEPTRAEERRVDLEGEA